MARLPRPSGVCRLVFVAPDLVGGSVANVGCFAYTAAGDRIFAPTGILPQIAPSDQIYAWGWTLPLSGEADETRSRMTNIGAFFDKTLTERLSLYSQGNWLQIDRVGTDPLYGFANFENGFKYLTINNLDREFLLTLGVNREWGATGASGIAPRRARPSRGSISARVWVISISAICGRSP